MDKKITVVTPTYNRAYILGEAYKSLKDQTNKSFIWMIIDDGSTDNTKELIEMWKNEDIVEIIYLRKKNGGKASALNLSLDNVKTKYYVCLDSDDIFTDTAIENALEELNKIEEDENYCGIVSLRVNKLGLPIGGKYIPNNISDIKIWELENKYKISSELTCFYKTNVVKKYYFPEIDGEKFISPEYQGFEISRTYKYLVSQIPYCICEYIEDGLTKNKISVIKKNPKGYTLRIKQSFELSENFIVKSKKCLMYISGSILSKDKDFIKNSPNKIMTILYIPIGILAYFIRFKINKKGIEKHN